MSLISSARSEFEWPLYKMHSLRNAKLEEGYEWWIR